MSDSPPPEPPAADTTLKSEDIPKRRSLSFGAGLKPKASLSSDGNKSDSGSMLAEGKERRRMRDFFAFGQSKKKQSAKSLSSDDKTTNSSTGGTDLSRLAADSTGATSIRTPPSRNESTNKLSTIPQGGSDIMERSTSSRTETGVQVVDPFRQAVTNAEKAIDKLQTAYTVLSSLSQLASVAQELLPGVGAAVGIVANMVNSAKTVAVNRVAALRLVSPRAWVIAKDRSNDVPPSCLPYSKPSSTPRDWSPQRWRSTLGAS